MQYKQAEIRHKGEDMKKPDKTRNQDIIKKNCQKLLQELGEDTQREGLINTPKRMAKALLELTSGYYQDLDKTINSAIFSTSNQQMVVVSDIEFFSLCEHHMLPFFGRVHVGYIPNSKVIGLSKVARIIDVFS